jgi:tRNA(fMet)-specific endonuclease VapC
VEAYARLRRHIDLYRVVPIVDYDREAAHEYARLRDLSLGVAVPDLKIAAIALARGAVLLTRNATDCCRVPGLHFEDWAV